jgi:hypothetical protein
MVLMAAASLLFLTGDTTTGVSRRARDARKESRISMKTVRQTPRKTVDKTSSQNIEKHLRVWLKRRRRILPLLSRENAMPLY